MSDLTDSNYAIVRGMPAQVETRVQALLKEGFELNGPLFPFDMDDGKTILIQALVRKYD